MHRKACRRSAGLAAAAVAALLPFQALAADGQCRTKPGALYAERYCARYGIQKDGRLAGCLPSENCVSSSAIKSPAQFDAPWLFSPATRDADKAFEELVKAAKASPEFKNSRDRPGATLPARDGAVPDQQLQGHGRR